MNRPTAAIAAFVTAVICGGVLLATTGDGTSEVRIVARQLDDGRVEFGLQQREDGEWGERILPASRLFPASVSHSRWLNSSPVQVSSTPSGTTPDSQRTGESERDAIIRTPQSKFYDGSRIFTSVRIDEIDDSLITSVAIEGDGDYASWEDPATLWVSCFGDNLEVWFSDLPLSDIGTGGRSDEYSVTYRFDSEPAQTQVWGTTSDYTVTAPNSGSFFEALKTHRRLIMRFSGYSETDSVTFDLTGAFETPVQPNLDYCGSY